MRIIKQTISFFLLWSVTGNLSAGEMHEPGLFDPSIVNYDKLIDVMKESGQIKASTRYEQENELKQILAARFKASQRLQESDYTTKRMKLMRDHRIQQKLAKIKRRNAENALLSPLLASNSETVRTDKILVILVEFADLDHQQITPEMTELYFDDYGPAHYQRLVFSETGFEGPNGESLISMNQYYGEQSGHSYRVSGEVKGWYRASKPAKYYGGKGASGRRDANSRELVKEALLQLAQDPDIDLSEFDQEDRYDSDGDGNYREPDGVIDHIMIFHASIGEESGGGQLGQDAIWSHRSSLGNFKIGDTPYFAGDYTVLPIDATTGVVAHEYAHDLGLPDEYDAAYTSQGSPVGHWSLMASGSWAGLIPGTEPTGFSPYAREFLQASLGGNWLVGKTVNFDDLGNWGQRFVLDQASIKGENEDAIRLNLPDLVIAKTPNRAPGQKMYSAHKIGLNSMSLGYDLSARSPSDRIVLKMDAYYEMQESIDFFVLFGVRGGIAGNRTEIDPLNPYRYENTISGSSNGWVKLEYDISAFAGSYFSPKFNYVNTSGERQLGLVLDNIRLEINGRLFAFDNVERRAGWQRKNLGDFAERGGNEDLTSEHYYLLEWRNHQGVDKSLAYLSRGQVNATPGLTVWYVNPRWGKDNRSGKHPGRGFLSLVDADPQTLTFLSGDKPTPWPTSFQ